MRQDRAEQQLELRGTVLDPVKIHDFGNQLVQIEAREMHVRRPRIFAEGIDHLLHRIHLGDDGVGGAFEYLRILRIHAAEKFALHALGGQLDRRQRILDFVRQAARDLAPGRIPLRLQQGRNVVEYQHHARRAAEVVRQRRAGAHEHALAGFRQELVLLAPIELSGVEPQFDRGKELAEQRAAAVGFIEPRPERGF
jgi:hypothetical protein